MTAGAALLGLLWAGYLFGLAGEPSAAFTWAAAWTTDASNFTMTAICFVWVASVGLVYRKLL